MKVGSYDMCPEKINHLAKKLLKIVKATAKSIRNITAKVIEKTKQTVKRRKNKIEYDK